MPFDDTNYRDPRDAPPPAPPGPRVSRRGELVLLILLTFLAAAFLLLPISAGALIDVGRAANPR